MKLTKPVLLFGLLFFSALPLQAAEAEIKAAPENPLRLEASLPADEFSFQEFTTLSVKLTNTGKEPVKIETMSCTKMDNWMTDSEVMVIAEKPCEKNEPVENVLEPGKTFETQVGLLVILRPEDEKHAFRAGFRAGQDPLFYAWSAPLKVRIKPDEAS